METLFANEPFDRKRWTALVENSAFPDVYYLPEYASAVAEIEQSEPVALVSDTFSCKMLAPLLIRHMSATRDDHPMDWLDAATPYGYGGILSLSTFGLVDTPSLDHFFEELHEWCSSRNIVCCVIRLHPLIEQPDWMRTVNQWKDRLHIHTRGITNSIELSRWNEKQDRPAMLRKDRCSDMSLANRTLRLSWSTADDDVADRNLGIFISLYDELMNRKGAETFYRYPKSYFTGLQSLGKRLGIALAYCGDKPAGASLFLLGQTCTHYHLSATNDLGRKHGASTLLVIEGARKARQSGCDVLHLGGGTRPGDSLEDFKSSFGGRSHVYHFITFIVDPKRFDKIRHVPNAPWPYNLPEPMQTGVRRR